MVAMLLTRLLQPRALYKVAEWLSSTGVDIVLDHDAQAFTDDCPGRMLDAISEQGEAIWLDVLGAAVQAYPAMLEKVMQYDITSVYFEGRYGDDTDDASSFSETLRVLVLYSRNKAKLDADRRQDHLTRLQAQLSMIQSKLNRRRYKSPVMSSSVFINACAGIPPPALSSSGNFVALRILWLG
jgi:hypothetical protein